MRADDCLERSRLKDLVACWRDFFFFVKWLQISEVLLSICSRTCSACLIAFLFSSRCLSRLANRLVAEILDGAAGGGCTSTASVLAAATSLALLFLTLYSHPLIHAWITVAAPSLILTQVTAFATKYPRSLLCTTIAARCYFCIRTTFFRAK